ncbi:MULTISPECIES: tripartite tricarboxylate transporter substrate-binding protein [unclassified Beijerinckia]|uniref:Bug family tripartite tricarboxylate transporter substrate binding protein n=1 Tax=unclassified Beijerinckia TaxID=2638183 RepID=UPI0008970EA8|nr:MULTISPECIES: tripartite tricarboxylate transporter substrate-binding protein [unclassified Beijerinckia]MDH7795626.1 tripartite-type tricarboxylate transporter receptor subunit TctC [Beijerinckia sp. GAS462]SEC09333.1 Tripartite-type tricarboxylate transporter, receptor component TctC [Beijerinckia sp. 28-YEA-48]
MRTAAIGLIVVALAAGTAKAQSPEDFYRNKTIDFIVPTSPGGDYDLRSRLVARHYPRLMPGNPNVVVRNMPGGLGVAAANWVAKVAPRDGTVLHMIFQNMPTLQAIGAKEVQFDVRQFGWIGNTTNTPNVINSWHSTGINKIEDVYNKELVVGAPGAASSSYVYPAAMNALLGTKFRIVTGYPGGNDVNLAMEKGEVGGRGSNSWASWKSGHPHWLAERKINILVQIGLERAPDLPNVPLIWELAKNDEDRAVLKFISSDIGMSRSVITTPGVPAERLAALRATFDKMMKDPEFLAEAAKTKMDISPSTAAQTQAAAESMLDAPPQVIARAKALIEGPATR